MTITQEPEKFTLFWNGPFSQWCPSRFNSADFFDWPAEFNTAEQYMMAGKAWVFNDRSAFNQILQAKTPRQQKAIGRTIVGFDRAIWEPVCMGIVYRGSHYKFSSNTDLMAHLVLTAGTTIVEASPEDKIWGIGLHETDPRCLSRSTWHGTNYLGRVLTQLRDDYLLNTVQVDKPFDQIKIG
jgi:ribA/ribD-fused uncharacterized protein